jgi:hypothetical protein
LLIVILFGGGLKLLEVVLDCVKFVDDVEHLIHVLTIKVLLILRFVEHIINILIQLWDSDIHVLLESFLVFFLVGFNLLDSVLKLIDLSQGLILRFFVSLGNLQALIFKDVVELTIKSNLIPEVLEML